MSPYSQQKMLREFMGMDDGDEFGAFACSVESTPAQTSKGSFFFFKHPFEKQSSIIIVVQISLNLPLQLLSMNL